MPLINKQKIFYAIKRVLIFILVTYCSLMFFLYFIQDRLLFPGHARQGQPETQINLTKQIERIDLTTNKGDKVVAILGQALTPQGKPINEPRPTLIYFYGNGMCIADGMGEFEQFQRLGLNVIMPDYVGYGQSGGTPSEANCYATADAVYDYLLTKKELSTKIIVTGWSLGGAVAIDLASRRPNAGLAAFSTFTSIKDMAKQAFPWFWIPTFILNSRFESQAKIANVVSPIFLGHGKKDDIIPWQMTDQLSQTAKGKVTTYYVENADHGLFFEVGGEKLWLALADFMGKLS